jgi:hypothetical protein
VLFDARGRVKLADFGAAGTTSTTAADARMQGLSPFTASPEQLRGEAPTESDDIYGLGALAYELLSGYPPYYPHFDIRKAQEEPVPNLVPTRQIPPLLSALVMRMLAKNRRERPRSMREVIDELDAALNDTLAFDFESIVDPSHGAPSAAVLVGPAPVPRAVAPAAAAKPAPKPPAPPPKKEEFEYSARDDDDLEDDEESEVEDEEEEGPDLGLIPDLLVANALVATPTPKGNRAASQTSTPAVAQPASKVHGDPQPRGIDAKAARNQPVKETSTAASSEAVAQARKSNGQTAQNGRASNEQSVHNDTMHLPVEPASPTRGGTAGAWRTSNAETVHNDTMQLPPEPAPTIRGVGAAWRASNTQTVNNDTMLLPPEPTSAPRGAAVASRGAYAHALNEQPVRQQPAPTRAPASTPPTAAPPPRYVSQRPTATEQPFAASEVSSAQSRAPRQPVGERAPSSPSTWQPQALKQASANAAADKLARPEMPGASGMGGEVNQAAAPNMDGGASRASAPSRASATVRGAAPRLVAGSNPGATSNSVAPVATPNSATAFGQAAGPQYATAYSQAAAPNSAAGTGRNAGPNSAAHPGRAAEFNLAAASGSAAESNRAAALRATPAPVIQHATFATAGLATDGGPSFSDERPMWENLKLDSVPRMSRLEPIPRRHWPVVLLGLLAGVAVAVFYWLPRYTTQSLPFDFSAISRATKNLAPSLASASDAATGATPGTDSSPEAMFQSAREHFDARLAALETRSAGVWGGPEFGLAKMRAAESVGAHDAGNTQMAEERLADASKLLDQVESKAAPALAAQIAAGQKALAAGQEELANQAFDLAKRIDPNDKRIADGQRHTHNLNGVLPLLADGQNAESARDYQRAAQDYGKALSLDPGNDKARAGLARANAAFGDDNYAKAVGSGFAALGAGRLDDARDAFDKAHALRPTGSEASDGLRRVSAALSAKGFSSLRQRAAGLEAQERWDEAVQAYDSALQEDPSLAFAQEGKDRAAARAELNASLQALIDRPERLSSTSVRNQAQALLDTANQQSPSGPVLRSQITRLGLLMPDYDSAVKSGPARADLMDKPVRLSLVSDNATDVAIPSIGQFGTFAQRDIQLKPGRYTVIGTRDGFRDVHRDITIAPGQESQTISVSCSDPI